MQFQGVALGEGDVASLLFPRSNLLKSRNMAENAKTYLSPTVTLGKEATDS